MQKTVPIGLKWSFVFHFVADMIFALPLMFLPYQFLGLLSWTAIDPITARLVAAALFAIGIKSLIGRNESIEVYRSMLTLKLMWSFFALLGLGLSLYDGLFALPIIGWFVFGTFFVFHLLWWYWKRRIS